MTKDACTECGTGARMAVGGAALCDRCFNHRLAELTGLPELPGPPPVEELTGADGRQHRLRYRLWRGPDGIVAEAEEDEVDDGPGYRLRVAGDHDDDPARLLDALRTRLRAEVGHRHLEAEAGGDGWLVAGTEVCGRIETVDPPQVVVDGRLLTWDELGRALAPYEGWQFSLLLDEGDDEAALGEVVELPVTSGAADDEDDEDDEDDDLLDDAEIDEFLADWDRAEAEGVELLRQALPEAERAALPADELAAACRRLRAGFASGRRPYTTIRRAAGLGRRPPDDDVELWVAAAGGLIAMRDESGLGVEEESAIMALEMADWLGAILGLVRGGVGASAEPEALVAAIDACPEVEGEVDPDDASLVGFAFELILPAWQAVGAVDERRRLTALGAWGLPRALAWAWNGELDEPSR